MNVINNVVDAKSSLILFDRILNEGGTGIGVGSGSGIVESDGIGNGGLGNEIEQISGKTLFLTGISPEIFNMEDINIGFKKMSIDVSEFINFIFCDTYCYAIKEDNTLWVRGSNTYGQLGLGDNIDRNVFAQVNFDINQKKIVSNRSGFVFILKQDGTLWSTGANNYGQLGLGDNVDRNTFTQVGTDSDWDDISIGEDFSLALKQDGTLWSTGANNYGQLGLGDNVDRNTFTQVGTDSDWKDIFTGQEHIIVCKQNKSVWSCGQNFYGQLGLSITDNYITMLKQITINVDNWKDICVYDVITFIIKQDGTLWVSGHIFNGNYDVGGSVYNSFFEFTLFDNNSWKYIKSSGKYYTNIGIQVDDSLLGMGEDWFYTSGLLKRSIDINDNIIYIPTLLTSFRRILKNINIISFDVCQTYAVIFVDIVI